MHAHSKKNHSSEKDPKNSGVEKQEPVPAQPAAKNDKVEVPAQEYEDLKKRVQELEGLREKFLLAAADFENAKKRNTREKDDFIKFSQERILREIIPVLDNFERAVNHANTASVNASGEEALQQNFKTLVSGVKRVEKQLFDILKLHGLTRIETADRPFNPHFHEVVAHVPETGQEDHIIDEMESGYMLHDRLLRAAKVRVRVPPQEKSAASDEKQDEIT